MILGRDEKIYDAAAFQKGLRRAVFGVVRVTIRSEGGTVGYSTGWLITDRLVVLPDFVISSDGPAGGSTYECHHVSHPDVPIGAEVVFSTHVEPHGSRPALLRLAAPLRKRALSLETRAAETGEQVFLLQHPGGAPEPHLSLGRVLHNEPPSLGYDADTAPGSSGAPVLSADWAVMAMHTRAVPDPKSNEGLTIAAIIEHLRESPAWKEIARHHKLADLATVRVELEAKGPETAPPIKPAEDEGLLAAAVRWSFDPKTIPSETVAKLRPLVPEPSARRWVLPAAERERALRSAGSMGVLREARGDRREADPRQRVIDRILDGPPYDLDEIAEEVLPHWLQATRWFANVVPSLPSPADVNEELERRRVRSRLEEIGGMSFRGRATQLAELHDWYADANAGPMVITGIGGIGKSALVAHFALDLLDETLLLWLDFDRADVAPDDAVSVLRVLFEQMTTQLGGFEAPSVDASSWEVAVNGLGAALAPHLDGVPKPLIVLDGFEVAQHAKRHGEIWKLMEMLRPQIPGVKVLVSGRAPVRDAELKDRSARTIHLEGLDKADADSWLRDAGIADAAMLDRLFEITRGIPLVLRLAVRWTESDGEIAELPEKLPAELVEGFLYQRILDRVIDPLLKPVARDALVLRRLTPQMIAGVLGDTLPKELADAEAFERLSREMSLAGDESESHAVAPVALPGIGALQLRPELRAATLRLLETDEPERVRTIDERAVEWYRRQDLENVANAAELAYHLLRLNDVRGAKQAWREGSESRLVGAEDELPENAKAARRWLHRQIREAAGEPEQLGSWENDARSRIRDLLARGVVRSVPAVLAERAKRTPESPLLMYDAWTLWDSGNLEGARKLLADAAATAGPVGRDRTLLAALLAQEAGDRAGADRWLATLADVKQWGDRVDPELDALTVAAARIRLTIDLESELKLLELLTRQVSRSPTTLELDVVLPPSDVVLPPLSALVGMGSTFKDYAETIRIPLEQVELESFAFEIERARGGSHRSGSTTALPLVAPEKPDPADTGLWRGSELVLARDALRVLEVVPEQGRNVVLDLAVLGWRRWRLATTTLFLPEACSQALQIETVGEPQRLSVVATLAAFRGDERIGSFVLFHDRQGALPEIVDRAATEHVPTVVPPPSKRRARLATRLLESAPGKTPPGLITGSAQTTSLVIPEIMRALPPEIRGPAFYLLSPEPLQMLVRQALAVPDSLVL